MSVDVGKHRTLNVGGHVTGSIAHGIQAPRLSRGWLSRMPSPEPSARTLVDAARELAAAAVKDHEDRDRLRLALAGGDTPAHYAECPRAT